MTIPFVNDRDVELQTAPSRFESESTQILLLGCSANVVKVSSGGTPTPASVSFSATLIGITGTVAYSTSPATTLTVAGNNATLALADMTAPTVTVTVTLTYDGNTYTAHETVVKVTDGASGSNGARGAGHYYASGAAWSNALADSATPGAGSMVNDVVTISDGTTFTLTKVWDGSAWVPLGAVFDGSLFVTGSIQASAVDTRGMVVRATDGTPIVGVGFALNAAYAAPGTLNSDLKSLPTIDAGSGSSVFGQRDRNDAPYEYPVGNTKQFKSAAAIGLPAGGSTYCTLETTKQYTDNSGGGVYQYAYQDAVTYRRFSPVALGNTGAWQAWVRDLDRNAYTGDLNATYGADASNLAVGLGGKNLLPANTLPSSAAGYVKGVSDPATVNSTNPTFATGGTTGLAGYSRNALGAVYLNVSGTPPAGSYADLFIDGAAKRPVVGGRRYEFAFDLSTHRCSGSAIILWYDASNANIGLSQSASIASAADYGTIDFPRALLLATAPAAATSAIVFARMLHDGVGINPYMFTSRWYFAEALAAQTVASPWTPSQHESLVAINDPVTGLSDKISKAAASILNALITISTSGGIQVGTASWNAGSPTGTGVVITPMGLALVQAGVVKALLPVSGEPTFGGRLTAAYGDFLGNIQAGPAGGFRVEMGPDDPTYALWAGTGTKNDANAIFFLKRSGAAYFGGALSSGTLKTSVANPSTAADAEIVDGPFGSIGHPITVNVGYDFHYTRSSTRHTLAIAGSPAPQATIQLWNGSTLVQTVTINGTSSVINDSEPGVPSNGQVTISGGFTWTDTSGSTAQRTLRAVISSRQYPNIGDLADKGSGTDAAAVITQQLSINTTEQ